MINAHEIHRADDDQSRQPGQPGMKFVAGLKRRISDSPLLAVGAAIGAGALAYGLLKPRPKQYGGVAGAVARAVGRQMRPKRTLKTAIGSLALGYLNRRVRSKLRWF